MGRDTERTVGTALLVVGTIALVVPVLWYRRGNRALAVCLAVVALPPGVLALSAGRKLRTHPPRREITLGKLYENVEWYRIWRRPGLI